MDLTDPRLDQLRHAMTATGNGRKQWAAIDMDAEAPVTECDSLDEAQTHVDEHGGKVYRRLAHGLAWELVQ